MVENNKWKSVKENREKSVTPKASFFENTNISDNPLWGGLIKIEDTN